MASNPNVNKVVFGNDTVMDITDTTAEAADVAAGSVFYAKSGARTVGTADWMEKVTNPTAGNFLATDANGQAVDSGKKPADYYTKLEADALLADKVDTDAQATDSTLGLVKLNPSQSIDVNASGQLTVGGRLGQFPTTTGIYASADRDPRAVGDASFLITDAMGMSLDTSRAFALVSGYGVTCKSAAAGTTQYRVTNNYANRLKCKMAEGGFASINEATSKVQRIVPVVSVTIGGNPYTPDSSANSSTDIIITTEETLNPDSAMTNIRLFGVMKSYSTVHVGNGIASLGGGRNLFVGGGITKAGSSNDDCAVGADMYVSGNGNAAFGRWHIMAKNRGFAAGTGHDFTNARGEGAAAVGQYSLVDANTLFAVGDGTAHTARSNAFEVVDGGIVLKSPDASRWKITVDNSGNLTTTKL